MSGFVARIMTSDKALLSLAQKAKIEEVMKEAERIAGACDSSAGTVLREILETVIRFRVALVVGDAEQKELSMRDIDRLYPTLPSVGLEEAQVAELTRRIVAIFTERREGSVPKRRRQR